jgi:hypothetical protein
LTIEAAKTTIFTDFVIRVEYCYLLFSVLPYASFEHPALEPLCSVGSVLLILRRIHPIRHCKSLSPLNSFTEIQEQPGEMVAKQNRNQVVEKYLRQVKNQISILLELNVVAIFIWNNLTGKL